MARRVLSPRARAALSLALTLAGCRHSEQTLAEAAAASASAATASSASSYASDARESHFESELKRARSRWESKPSLGDCTAGLHEKADLELCQAAQKAVTAIELDLDAPPERALPLLAEGALAMTRLSQRARYLSLAELAKKRLQTDGGVLPVPSATTRAPLARRNLRDHAQRGTFELSDGPVSRLMGQSVHLERDLVRNIGAYLEYGPLPNRRAAFETVKHLRDEHPQWPLVTQLLREAALLESDADLKQKLQEFSARGLPPGGKPGQSPDSK